MLLRRPPAAISVCPLFSRVLFSVCKKLSKRLLSNETAGGVGVLCDIMTSVGQWASAGRLVARLHLPCSVGVDVTKCVLQRVKMLSCYSYFSTIGSSETCHF